MRRTVAAITTLALIGASGCGYAFVKKSELNRPPKIIVDSAQVVALRSQLADAESRCRADSVKYEAALQAANAKPAGVPDSVLKARDADIASLKDQLAKAQAELDRIKRRLATPRS